MSPTGGRTGDGDPLLERFERILRHARCRFGARDATPPQNGAAKRELAALITDLDALIRELKTTRSGIRAELDAALVKVRAGSAYRSAAALRPPASNSRAPQQGNFR